MIHAFLKLNEIPDGPLFLRDFGLHRGNELKSFKNHKINTLNHLFKFYDFPFVLIGDATENDTKYYVETFKKFPNRVKAIFIRESKRNRKNEKIQEIIDKNPEIPLILFSDLNEILACLEK